MEILRRLSQADTVTIKAIAATQLKFHSVIFFAQFHIDRAN